MKLMLSGKVTRRSNLFFQYTIEIEGPITGLRGASLCHQYILNDHLRRHQLQTLLDLLDRIHSGDMVLPDFQRDFVWEPSATKALIVSIAKNYPAASILRVRDRQRAFSSREFEGAPPPASEHTFRVLDGQQRLTSLYQAFYAVLQLLAPTLAEAAVRRLHNNRACIRRPRWAISDFRYHPSVETPRIGCVTKVAD